MSPRTATHTLVILLFLGLGPACGGVTTEQTDAGGPDSAQGDGGNSLDGAGIDVQLGPAQAVFVTSITFDPTLNGLDGADALCQERANRGGLAGNWAAIMMDSDFTLEDRLVVTGPIVNVAGVMLAATPADFFANNLVAANSLNESGNVVPNPTTVWIGSAVDSCNGWDQMGGAINGGTTTATGTGWAGAESALACDTRLAIQCMEQ